MEIDKLHYAILNQLQSNARLSNAEIGRRIGLTAPAVAERIRRMQDAGIIKGFSTDLDFDRLGFGQRVWVAVKLSQSYNDAFLKKARATEGVVDIIHTTGEYCFFVAIIVPSPKQLGNILASFGKLGETTTFSILDVPLCRKSIQLNFKG